MTERAGGEAWTVRDLKRALAQVPDDLQIVVRGIDEDGGDFCGGIFSAEVERSHDEDESPFFAIDATNVTDVEDEGNDPDAEQNG
jgi:hypothetical protein